MIHIAFSQVNTRSRENRSAWERVLYIIKAGDRVDSAESADEPDPSLTCTDVDY